MDAGADAATAGVESARAQVTEAEASIKASESRLAQARVADERRSRGEAGPLTGIPVAQKDIFCTDGIRTSCASRMLDNFVAPYDATVVARLSAAAASSQSA